MADLPSGKTTTLEVCPSIEDLSSEMKRNVLCPVTGCEKTFNHDNALRMHVIKTHKIFQDEKDNAFFYKFKAKNPPCVYHCPVTGCKYQMGAERHFNSYATLKQHFKVVHKEKKFVCDSCGFKFGIESAMKRHKTTCGVIYKCGTCECPYATREALLTHCRRKQHIIPERHTKITNMISAPAVVQYLHKNVVDASVVMNSKFTDDPQSKSTAVDSGCVTAAFSQLRAGDSIEQTKVVNGEASSAKQNTDIGNRTLTCSRATGSHYNLPVGSSIGVGTERQNTATGCQKNNAQSMQPKSNNNTYMCNEVVGPSHQCVSTTFSQVLSSPVGKQNVLPDLSPAALGVNMGRGKNYVKTANKSVTESSIQPVINLFVINVNTEGTMKSPMEQTLSDSRLVSILPKPPLPHPVVKQMQETDLRMLNNPPVTSKTSSVVQTSEFTIDRTSAETQTTGDYVLMKAMQSANIPIQKESRGAQVSPRAKVRGTKRSLPAQMTSTSVQTGTEAHPVLRRKRRKKLPKGSDTATASTSSAISQATSPEFPMPDLLDFGFSDCETQTMALIEELEASLAASTSTQTRESFLANPLTWPETSQPPLPMQTIETQTLSIDTGVDTTEGFSLLNFLNSADGTGDNQASRVQTPSSFDHPMTLENPMRLPDASLSSMELPTRQLQPMMNDLNPGGSLDDASAQTTEVSTAIQTQTIDTMFSQLLSNMETQTSDDLPLLELGFADNQTQTPFELDLIESQANVETQTSLHVSANTNTSNVQSIDTETQTLFPNLTSTDSHTQTSLADLERFMNL